VTKEARPDEGEKGGQAEAAEEAVRRLVPSVRETLVCDQYSGWGAESPHLVVEAAGAAGSAQAIAI